MITLLIWFIIICIVATIVWRILMLVPMPPVWRSIVPLVFLLFALIVVLNYLPVGHLGLGLR